MELNYIKCGDYYIPDIRLQKPNIRLGHYGMLRKAYLREHRPALYAHLVLSETLYEHCAEIEQAARSRLDLMMPELAKSAGATEELKAQDPMKWVGLMNSCKRQISRSRSRLPKRRKADERVGRTDPRLHEKGRRCPFGNTAPGARSARFL